VPCRAQVLACICVCGEEIAHSAGLRSLACGMQAQARVAFTPGTAVNGGSVRAVSVLAERADARGLHDSGVSVGLRDLRPGGPGEGEQEPVAGVEPGADLLLQVVAGRLGEVPVADLVVERVEGLPPLPE